MRLLCSGGFEEAFMLPESSRINTCDHPIEKQLFCNEIG
jgi:hypothetical protein